MAKKTVEKIHIKRNPNGMLWPHATLCGQGSSKVRRIIQWPRNTLQQERIIWHEDTEKYCSRCVQELLQLSHSSAHMIKNGAHR